LICQRKNAPFLHPQNGAFSKLILKPVDPILKPEF
jgi:hypothetical protein